MGIVALALGGCAGLARPTDDRTLDTRAQSEAAALAKRVPTYDDPRLADYLTRVAGRVGQGRLDLRLIVLEDPTAAAFTLPNGRLYIHTGLLSRLENEAQLATIIARELARSTNAHARGAGDTPAMTGGLPRGELSPTAAAILGLDLRLAAAAAIGGYGAGRERQADAEALRRLTRAGYDPEQAPRIFERLARANTEGGPREIFLYGNRPRLDERYEAIRARLGETGSPRAAASGDVGDGATFTERMRAVVRDNAALDLRAGRFALAQGQLDRVLATTPNDPIAQVHYGDLDRLRSQRAATAPERAEYARQALGRYQRALELDPTYAAPFRELGLLYYQEREIARARAAFERYLAAAPDARDARRIREYLAVVGE